MPNKIDWDAARQAYENGESMNSIAKRFGCAVTTVANHRDKEEWERITDNVTNAAGAVVTGFGDEVEPVEVPEYQQQLHEAAKRIAELEAEQEELKEQVKTYRPTADVEVYDTLEGAAEAIGPERLHMMAEARLADVNKARIKAGHFPIDWREDPVTLEQTIDSIVEDILAARTKYSERSTLRVVKMVMDGQIIQVPHEVQISNEAGQSGAAIWKMRDQGAKLAVPFLCMRHNCWLPAETHPDGTFVYDGYCGQQHLSTDPYIGKPTEGVTGSAQNKPNLMKLLGR